MTVFFTSLCRARPALLLAVRLLATLLVLDACAPLPPSALSGAPLTVSRLRLIGEQRVPLRQPFGGTLIGGLSGIDYDARRGDWVLVSDDRSERSPSRYYRARLDYDDQAFRAVTFSAAVALRQPDGSPYPSKQQFARLRQGVVADLESVRIDPHDGAIWYASEGDLGLGLPPFVRRAAPDGRFLAELPLPPIFNIDASGRFGPRDNLNVEGMSFAPDGNSLWLALEEPLYQDGPMPSVDTGAINRITRLGRDGAVIGQYAYRLGALAAAPGAGKYGDNGISEIVALSDTRLLAMERSAIENDAGVYRQYVRIYEIDTAGATDVQHAVTLVGTPYRAVAKRLLLDLDSVNLPRVDNLEGMAIGPRLANGHASLVLVSDDNFNKSQVTQLLVFEVIP